MEDNEPLARLRIVIEDAKTSDCQQSDPASKETQSTLVW